MATANTEVSRRARFASALPARGIEAAVVTALPNLRYLTGFTGSNGLLVVWRDGTEVFLTDPRYTFQAAQQVPGVKVVTARGALIAEAAKLLLRSRAGVIGFEDQRISFLSFQSLAHALGNSVQLQPLEDTLELMRLIKDEAELDLIRRSVALNSQAFEKVVPKIKPGLTEQAIAVELDRQMRLLGAEQPAFETIVAAGPRTALPHARPTSQRLSVHQLLLVDMGASREGYASDMTRMLHLGRPGTQARSLYRAVLEAQLAALDAIKHGVTAGRVDAAARRVLKAHGLDKAFMHSTGHGLGLEIHEGPRIGKGAKPRLAAGMAITVEPGAYLEGFGGVRIEDTVVVTKNGCEILTPTSKELRVL